MKTNHIIHKQTVEVTFSNKSETQELFQKISNLFNRQVCRSTERIMDQVVVGDMLISIDSLEIDLGSFALPLNETELIKRFEMALKKSLQERIDKLHQRTVSTVGGEGLTEFCLTPVVLLQHFLLNGNLPYWGGGAVMNKPEAIFNSVLEHDREALKSMLLMIGTHRQVRMRMVHQFSLKLIHDTIYVIEPYQAPYIITYHQSIAALQHREQMIKTEAATFEKSLWQFILTYLLVEMGSRFERKMFVQSTLSQMAAHFNLSYHEVLHLFGQVAVTHKQMVDHHLSSLIVELMDEASPAKPLNKQSDIAPFEAHEPYASDDDVLLYFLFYGSLPYRYQHYSVTHVQSLLAHEIKAHPDRILQILNNRERSQQMSLQLSHLPNALLREIVNLLEPTQTQFIENYHTSVMGVQSKKNIIKTQERDFRDSLWHFIMAFLLNNGGSMFNAKTFVESNIRQMANHYNMGFANLLLLLAQGIGEEMLNVNASSALFHIVTEILHQQQPSLADGASSAKTDVVNEPTPEQELVRQRIALQNALLHWLTQGYWPWWGQRGNLLPETLFVGFITSHPHDAYRLLQQATKQGLASALQIRNVAPQIVTLLKQAPDGDLALSRVQLFEQVALHLNYASAKELVLEALFSALLLTYHQSHFQRFDLTNFIQLLKQTLANQQPEVMKQLISALKKNGTALAVSTANTLLKNAKNENTTMPYSFTEQYPMMPFDEQNLVVDGVVFSTVDSPKQLSMAIDLVTYFLKHNHFPTHIHINDRAKSNYLLQHLILLIHQLDSSKLTTLFNHPDDSPMARMRLHDVFAIQYNRQCRQVVAILAPFVERDIIRYIRESCQNPLDASQLGALFKRIDKHYNATQRKKLYQTMMQSPAVACYVAAQFKGDEYWHVVRQLTNDKCLTEIKNHAYMLALAIGDSFEREKLQIHLREFCLDWFSATSPMAMSFFFPRFLQFLAQKTNWSMLRLHDQITLLVPKCSNTNKELQSLALHMQNQTKQYANHIDHYNTLHQTQQKQAHELLEASLGRLVVQKPQNQLLNPTAHLLDEVNEPHKKPKSLHEDETLFVNNAGMVLLHPFISTYFSRVGLTEGVEFTSIDAQHKATHLLQYLVNNARQTPEEEMVLNKVLCGLPIDEPIVGEIEITDHEKETAHGLLNAVIQNWDKLKNTSVEGLQASFLQRAGMLTEREDGWMLKIEQRSFDLLLQTLPWGLSMIKYPWMNKTVYIEWA